jgi:hypothetical protein
LISYSLLSQESSTVIVVSFSLGMITCFAMTLPWLLNRGDRIFVEV